nr:DUF2865 domain-containing protein [Ochrobactrum sp. MYb49]
MKIPRGLRIALTYCVRLSDGYFFPAPHSQFRQKGGADATLAQCRFICESNNMAVYVLNDPNEETASMVSQENGETYISLPTAYDYQGEGDFKRCNWNGYISKITELALSRKHRKSLVNTMIPLPQPKPENSQGVRPLSAAVSAFQPMKEKKVRLVGPAFMPDKENSALSLMGAAVYHTPSE